MLALERSLRRFRTKVHPVNATVGVAPDAFRHRRSAPNGRAGPRKQFFVLSRGKLRTGFARVPTIAAGGRPRRRPTRGGVNGGANAAPSSLDLSTWPRSAAAASRRTNAPGPGHGSGAVAPIGSQL